MLCWEEALQELALLLSADIGRDRKCSVHAHRASDSCSQLDLWHVKLQGCGIHVMLARPCSINV